MRHQFLKDFHQMQRSRIVVPGRKKIGGKKTPQDTCIPVIKTIRITCKQNMYKERCFSSAVISGTSFTWIRMPLHRLLASYSSAPVPLHRINLPPAKTHGTGMFYNEREMRCEKLLGVTIIYHPLSIFQP